MSLLAYWAASLLKVALFGRGPFGWRAHRIILTFASSIAEIKVCRA
ncbi:hypothetical protein ABIA22_004944 [Sinorhizobium fredii]